MKSLIAITSCNRLNEVQKYIWPYLQFVNENSSFHFVLALDGKDQGYIDFCEEWDIPLIYSEEREGVGLSKNRVLTKFPEYRYYFFFEDDVELIDTNIFEESIYIYKETGYPHLCGNFRHKHYNTENINGFQLNYSLTGDAGFLFFSKRELEKVGGYHTLFSKYKRFGHSEHTYRFYHANMQPSPFICPVNFESYMLTHNPESVSRPLNIVIEENQWIQEEAALIKSGSKYYPLNTLSDFIFNKKKLGYNQKVVDFLKANNRAYPFLDKKQYKIALGERYALLISKTSNSHFKNLIFAFKSMWYAPMNNELKHKVKFYFKK